MGWLGHQRANKQTIPPVAIVSDNEEENIDKEVGCSATRREKEREFYAKKCHCELMRLCCSAGRWQQKQLLR